ncbi:MAG: T9SS type A sorting domain-containing protein, partial [Bacteroidia bacterium]|nr:T9SS type A sorting domain-containing protein [Bacteroidia bacterium]
SSNYGEIARISFIVDSTITTTENLPLEIVTNEAINYNPDSSITFIPGKDTLKINPTSIKEIAQVTNVNIYPNPYKSITNIEYQLNKQSFISLDIYNVLGKKVTTLVNENQTPGTYLYSFGSEIHGLESGSIFFIKLRLDNTSQTFRIIEIN